MESIHGHEVIDFIDSAKPAIKEEALLDAIIARFGSKARFHTCSLSGMTPKDFIEFLKAADKMHVVKGVCRINKGNVCSHD